MVKPSVMEMRMVLAMVTRSVQAIETAQRELEIQNRDLTRQIGWIKEEITKELDAAPKPTTDLDVLWERMKPHWKGDMGPAFVYLGDIKPLFKPEP